MSFDISRLRRADQIGGGGAIAFFIFLFFFNWFGVSAKIGPLGGVNVGSVSKSGWDTFTNSRWIWLITIIVALGAVVLVATQRKLESPVQPGVIVAGLGALSTILILYRIIHHPTANASIGALHASAGIKIGIWLGLIAALAITYGGYLQMREEGTSLVDVRERASGAFSGLTSPAGGPPTGGSPPASTPPGQSSATPAPPAAPPTATPLATPAPPAPSPPPARPPAAAPAPPPAPPPAAAPTPPPGSPSTAPPIPPPAPPPMPPPATPPGAGSSGETPPSSQGT